MPTKTFFITDKCSGLIRMPGVTITTLDGRLTGTNISFNTTSYDEYKMRRKAEVLQYNTIQKTSENKKMAFSHSVNVRGSYSQAQLKKIAYANEINCPVLPIPATNSGVNAEYKMKYYYDPKITYYPLL
jgi:hypothetical protein